MRKLGIDFGTKKVGLALTDQAGNMAFPHSVVPNDAELLDVVTALIADEGVIEIVVGHSIANDGTPNAVHAHTEAFIADVTLRSPVPIHLEPEQMTTAQAAKVTGKNDQTDAAAAAVILNSWLEKQKNKSEGSPTSTEEEESVAEISFDDFIKVEIKIGTIVAVEIVEGADKLLKLAVDVGESESRQILSGIREYFEDEQSLVGRQCPFITNLAPRKIRGFESQGMILAGEGGDTFSLLHPSTELPAGTRLY